MQDKNDMYPVLYLCGPLLDMQQKLCQKAYLG